VVSATESGVHASRRHVRDASMLPTCSLRLRIAIDRFVLLDRIA
jgi:hypothetical protein